MTGQVQLRVWKREGKISESLKNETRRHKKKRGYCHTALGVQLRAFLLLSITNRAWKEFISQRHWCGTQRKANNQKLPKDYEHWEMMVWKEKQVKNGLSCVYIKGKKWGRWFRKENLTMITTEEKMENMRKRPVSIYVHSALRSPTFRISASSWILSI